MSERYGYIYMHTSPSEQSYIGKSIEAKGKRWQDHVRSAYEEKYKEYNYPLQRAIRKYGEDAFTTTILEECVPESILSELEILYIEKYDTFYNGYNQTKGGEGTSGERSDEAKQNIARANQERIWTQEMIDKVKQRTTGSTLIPWFIKFPDGSYQEFYNINKADYALSKGYHVGSFKNMFSIQKNVGVEVQRGKFKGYTFGNIGEQYE